mgnify:CR=1 FL=1
MKATPQNFLRFIAGAAVAAAVLFLVWYFSSIVVYILVSAVLAVMGNPLVKFLSGLHFKGWQVPRWLAALATLVVIWVVLATLCSLFVPLVFNKINQFAHVDFAAVVGSIGEPIARMQHDLQALFSLPESTFSLSDELTAALRQIIDINSLNTIFSSVINLVLSSVIAVFSVSFITFFFLKEEGLFYAMVTSVFPEHYHDNITRALDSVTVLLARYFTGILSESLLLTIAVTLVMMAFGMKAADAGFIGLIMGVMNVVPYAGPLIGGVVSVFVGIVSPIEGMSVGHTAFVIAGSLLILKGMDDFILQPTLYSERVKAHPLEIFIVILIAGSLAGIVGMLLAIPSYTVLRVFAKEFFSQFRFCHSFAYQWNQFFDAGVVATGGHAHLFLFFCCFDLADMVDNCGCIDISISHLQFHQAKQEPRRPCLINTDGFTFSHIGSQNFHTVIRIIKIYNFDSQFFFILRKQLSDHQYRLFFHIQSENHHTFSTCIILSRQIIHCHRIRHKKLFQIHLAHAFDYFFYSRHVHLSSSFLFAPDIFL